MNIKDGNLKVHTVEEWVDLIRNNKVVLPMIQRGSVWKPHQVLDLWDSLLQGMPLGAFMTSLVKERTMVFDLMTRKTVEAVPDTISLLDGQQRTLAILSVWPDFEKRLQRKVNVWVDLGDTPPIEYRFRLWATTQAQPFGYERVSVGSQILGKLSRAELRIANAAFSSLRKVSTNLDDLWENESYFPWRATFPIKLSRVISDETFLNNILSVLQKKISSIEMLIRKLKDLQENAIVIAALERKLGRLIVLHEKESNSVLACAKKLQDSVRHARSVHFPLIPVDRYIDEESTNESDPPVAILFKRIAIGGQPLTDEDYIFSLLKSQQPEIHNLVEDLLKDKIVMALYSPNTLVMAGVRACLMKMRENDVDQNKRLLYDAPKIDKIRFTRLAKMEDLNFSEVFINFVSNKGEFPGIVQELLGAISYEPDKFRLGLPLYAIPWLVDRYLFDILIAWRMSYGNNLLDSRLPMVRFLLWGALCVQDKAAASQYCIERLYKNNLISDIFPDHQLMEWLVQEENGKKYAYRLPPPMQLEASGVAITANSEGKNILRGPSRFMSDNLDESQISVYKKWWNFLPNRYPHPFLLWLQRDMIFGAFNTSNPSDEQLIMAGMEDETPYDFDHIVPESYWYVGTGNRSEDNIRNFFVPDDAPHYFNLCNSIGNVRVWPLDLNRQDGDASPAEKLRLLVASDDTKRLCSESLINLETQREYWIQVSVDRKGEMLDDKSKKSWNEVRARAFQHAIELRALDLYARFYRDLDFRSVAENSY